MRARFAIAMLIAVFAACFLSSQEAAMQAASCFVTTFQGPVQGVDLGGSCGFLGIPFAAPPVGNLRWKPPQPAAPWAPATLTATAAATPCAQVTPPASTSTAGTENCLRVNIWTPDPVPVSPVPVIVWIHTGAFQAASASIPDSNPQKLVERTGAIVVAANYRHGPFGFLAHPALTAEIPGYPSSGNYGLLDQRAALLWVRDHIAAFGGDPHNVTIGGQSAGGHSVSFHLVSPGSAGFFHRAIMQSGFASAKLPTLSAAESTGSGFAARVGCTDPAQVLTCMRSKTTAQVLLAFGNGQQEFVEHGRVAWGPVVDGLEVPDQPRVLYEHGRFSRVPVILGTTRDEGWIYADRSFPAGLTTDQYEAAVETEFGGDAPVVLAQYPAGGFPSPKLALSQLAGDFEAVCEARRVARAIARTRTPVYLYSFAREAPAVVQVPAGTPNQVIHGLDRNFVFGNNFGPPSNYVLNADDLSLFGSIADYWTNFAATGSPNRSRHDRRELGRDRRGRHGGDDDDDDDNDVAVQWRAFKGSHGKGAGSEKHLVLDVPIRTGERLSEQQCDFWEPFFLGSAAGAVPAASAAAATDDLCGATIVENLKLDHDLVCAGNGLIVGADGIKIDLRGHSITGSGGGVGISVAGRTNVSISGGTVRNFEAGVRLAESTDIEIKHVEFAQNVDGVDSQLGSRGITVKENLFQNNRSRGIMIRFAIENVVEENTFVGNRVGILLFAAVDAKVKENLFSTSGLAGIRINVFATGNLIEENTVVSNPAGIEFLVTPTGSSIGNALVENRIAMNACGLKGPTDGNTLEENSFESNGADRCP
jgi:para-nitrobenzyl esterase